MDVCGDDGGRPQKPMHPFCHAQKVDRKNPWVGLLARKGVDDVTSTSGFTFPGICRVVCEAACPHSQWRDRAGFAPVFPFMPSWAPKAGGFYHGGHTATGRARLTMMIGVPRRRP